MKRARLGDVFAIRLFNGYKLIQWAYAIPRFSDYVRVFDGLYDEIPDNLFEIINGPHGYIIGFDIKRMYCWGIAQLLGNFVVPEEYPYPDLSLRFRIDTTGEIYEILVENSCGSTGDFVLEKFPVGRMEDLPPEYQSLRLIGRSFPSNDWLLYLFDTDFRLTDPRRYYVAPPGNGDLVRQTLQPYTDLIKRAEASQKP